MQFADQRAGTNRGQRSHPLLSRVGERRRDQRVPHQNIVSVRLVADDENAGRIHDACAFDLSRLGIGFWSLAELPSLRIVVDLELPGSGILSAPASIVRGRRIDEGLWEYGAEFDRPLAVDELPECCLDLTDMTLPVHSRAR